MAGIFSWGEVLKELGISGFVHKVMEKKGEKDEKGSRPPKLSVLEAFSRTLGERLVRRDNGRVVVRQMLDALALDTTILPGTSKTGKDCAAVLEDWLDRAKRGIYTRWSEDDLVALIGLLVTEVTTDEKVIPRKCDPAQGILSGMDELRLLGSLKNDKARERRLYTLEADSIGQKILPDLQTLNRGLRGMKGAVR